MSSSQSRIPLCCGLRVVRCSSSMIRLRCRDGGRPEPRGTPMKIKDALALGILFTTLTAYVDEMPPGVAVPSSKRDQTRAEHSTLRFERANSFPWTRPVLSGDVLNPRVWVRCELTARGGVSVYCYMGAT